MVLILAAPAWLAAGAAAQTPDQPPSLSVALRNAGVSIGDVVYVTDATGNTVKGKLAAVEPETLKLAVGSRMRSLAVPDVRRLQWQRQDSLLNGVAIGSAVGAVPGVYWLFVDANECTGLCPEEYGLIAVGALAGGLIDHLVRRKVIVYQAVVSRNEGRRMMIGPLVTRDRTGVLLQIGF